MPMVKVKSDITGRVWKIVAQPGQVVTEEDTIMILESMKMEIPVTVSVRGKLKEVLVKEDEEVAEGQDLAIVET